MVDFLLLTHVIAGTTALGCALVAITSKKGLRIHVVAGRIYVVAMSYITLSALILATVRPNPFLFAIGLFSGFIVWTGYRMAVNRTGVVTTSDRITTAIGVIIVFVMLGYGGILTFSGDSIGFVLIVFGLIIFSFVWENLKFMKSSFPKGKQRIAGHLQRMLGGTIATITAVLVQQVAPAVEGSAALTLLIWLGPTAVITPLITYWSKKTLS